ncbi:MAG TPA: transcription elongation factor [Opitutaceae bacterium]|nr:transcription elongation factor [Opitutaceae bacterium]
MDKSKIVSQVLQHLASELNGITEAAKDSFDGATDEQSKAEGQFDTRALESSYLAEGQARLAAELKEAIAVYQTLDLRPFESHEPIAMTAVVALEQLGKDHLYFVGPRDGGHVVDVEGRDVMVITPQSPIGQILLGKTVGSVVRFGTNGTTREGRIKQVS